MQWKLEIEMGPPAEILQKAETKEHHWYRSPMWDVLEIKSQRPDWHGLVNVRGDALIMSVEDAEDEANQAGNLEKDQNWNLWMW